VRAEYNLNANGSFNPIIRQNYNRIGNDVTARTRAAISLDVRNQTEYGTLRSYFQGGWTVTNGGGAAPATYGPRAFIQLAGFTAGLAGSFFDAFSFARYSNQTNVLTSDTGGAGIITFAYTAEFGNGLSASVAIEDQAMRRTTIAGTSVYGGTGIPDVVANLRVDQAWGSAQIMGALHEVKPATLPSRPPTTTTSWAGRLVASCRSICRPARVTRSKPRALMPRVRPATTSGVAALPSPMAHRRVSARLRMLLPGRSPAASS
jgi:hypothetical protein